MAMELGDRQCTVTTVLGEGVLELKRMRATEKLSSLFEMSLDLASTDASIQAKDIVGTSLTVKMPLPDGDFRYFNGMVSRFTQLGTYQSDRDRLLVAYHATAVPWFWKLTRNHDCRVFENKSVVEIAETIFGDRGFSDYEFFKLATDASGEQMNYCVQYRESDFDFISRLFEQWGLSYTFEHSDDKHVLRVFDDSIGLPDNAKNPSVEFTSEEGTAKRGDVDEWCDRHEFVSGKFMLKDYNFEDPTNDLEMPVNCTLSFADNSSFEIFDCPGEYVTEHPSTGARGKAFVGFRMEAEEVASRRIEGKGVCSGFVCGTHFTMNSHFNDDYNKQKFLLTEVDHYIRQSVGTEKDPAIYENSFACIPTDVPYRTKQKTEKPVVVGTHTALVVGPSGEEIHCDEYGRVRIQFPWDRYGKKDGVGVCWARVQQSVGGKQWGMQFLPRIGQEVVVTFLEGDPDKPLITGVVYNKNNMPPYALPDNKTRSGVKTRSTKEGSPDNFNEIRFEDKKGSEELFIQAERDEQIAVKNDKTESVGKNETIDIGVDRTASVGANETLSVGGSRSRTVGATETITVSAARTLNVGVNDMTNVGAAQEVTVGGAQAVTVGAAQVTSVGGNRSVNVGNNLTENVGSNYTLKSGGNLQISASGDITVKSGKAKLVLKKSGDILLQGKKIQIKGSSDVVVKGSKIAEN